MAKRKSGRVRRVFSKIHRSYRKSASMGGLGSIVKPVLGAVAYAGAAIAAAFIPVGLDANLKKWLTIALMWVVGGMKGLGILRDGAKFAIALEAFQFVGPFLAGMIPAGQAQASTALNSI